MITIADIKQVENDLKIQLTEQERNEVLSQYQSTKGSYQDDNWTLIVEDIIYNIKK